MTTDSQFRTVFCFFGTLGDDDLIKLKGEAQPHFLHTPRNTPLPLHGKVQEELTQMEDDGIISNVDESPPWCTGMVVVPKKSGAIRIYVDLKKLNESVLKEVHPMPKVDEILALLAGATIFSLDANSSFGKSHLPRTVNILQHSYPYLGIIVLINCLLALLVPQNYFRNK